LSRHVEGPPELARRLDQIGIVEHEKGAELAAELRPGQRLVTRDGALWRWDGFRAADAATSQAARLEQRNRLEVLAAEIPKAAAKAEACRKVLDDALARSKQTAAAETAAREAVSEGGDAFAAARDARRDVEGQRQAAEARRDDLGTTAERIARERDELTADMDEAKAALAQIPPEDDGSELESLSASLDAERAVLAECQDGHDQLRRDAAFRKTRLDAIAGDRQSWSDRAKGADQRIGDLAQRRERAEGDKAELEERPQRIAEQRTSLVERLEVAEQARRQASDARAEGETALGERDRALKQAESALADAREERARREGAVEQGRQAESDMRRQIAERLETAPEPLGESISDRDTLPEADDLEQRFAKVVRERDNMGPVNLRAEIEAGEVEEQLAVMLSEKEDLDAAIARLRRGIQELNREGRERLVAAFNEIDGHFQSLHKRLFGGHARLTLVDSDDPLEAGLEIEASPSGKKLQSLSLLSGGEQALTALALIFALFQTNPSPVCVLDEVDAPLDDANVDRFCDLLHEFASEGRTRFLVITHHRLTMARMDRLFGVTMSEPGVSQLVSVDLTAAEAIRATG
jgi:chromosome segregation protein